MAVQRIPKELRYRNDLYKKTSAEITALAKERAAANKKRIAAKKKTSKTKKKVKTLFDTKEYKKAIKELHRQAEIYSMIRSSKINQIRRISKKAGYSISAKTLGVPTARQLSSQMRKQLIADIKSLLYLPSELQRVRMQQKIKEVEQQSRSLVEQYALQLEQAVLELRGGELPDEARKLYEIMVGTLEEGMNASHEYSQLKAKKMYEFTIKMVNEDVTWMKYAIRLKKYLPDIEAVILKYLYAPSDGGNPTEQGMSYSGDTPVWTVSQQRYECWNKVIRIFWENVFDDSEFRHWLLISSRKDQKVPSRASINRTMQDIIDREIDNSTNPRFAMDLESVTGDLNDI